MLEIYRIEIQGNDDIGYEANLSGIYQNKPYEVLEINKTHIVLKSTGYAENPGSRYSGLSAYYPPEITVYEITKRTSKTRFECKHAVSWQTGRGKNKHRVTMPTQ